MRGHALWLVASIAVLCGYAAGADSVSSYLARSAAAVAKGAAKATGYGLNAAVGVLRPTHVDLAEILTAWRLNQEVSIGKRGQTISCPATIEFRKGGKVRTRYEDEVHESTFTFKHQKWPRPCTIEFEARAFQGPYDKTPVIKRYKGRFQRSLLNPSLITIKGKVYEPLTAQRRRTSSIGTFTATRRPALLDRRRTDDDFEAPVEETGHVDEPVVDDEETEEEGEEVEHHDKEELEEDDTEDEEEGEVIEEEGIGQEDEAEGDEEEFEDDEQDEDEDS